MYELGYGRSLITGHTRAELTWCDIATYSTRTRSALATAGVENSTRVDAQSQHNLHCARFNFKFPLVDALACFRRFSKAVKHDPTCTGTREQRVVPMQWQPHLIRLQVQRILFSPRGIITNRQPHLWVLKFSRSAAPGGEQNSKCGYC